MTSFQRVGSSGLYVADTNTEPGGWGFAITRALPDGQDLPAGPIALGDALTNLTWQGSLIYVATGAFPEPQPFLDQLAAFIQKGSSSGRGALLLLPDGSAGLLDPSTLATYAWLNRGAQTVALSGPLLSVRLTGVDGFSLHLNPNAGLSVPAGADQIDFDLDPDQPVATLIGTNPPAVTFPPSTAAHLHVGGPASGAFTFSLKVVESSLLKPCNWGFQFLLPVPSGKSGDYIAAWLPFADAGPPNATLTFTAQVNPVNPRNQLACATRTVLLFGDADVQLASCYRTNYGKPITLSPVTDGSGEPAGLVINAGYKVTPQQNGYRLAPVGDFVMSVANAKPGVPVQLLCGLSGTETIDFLPDLPSAKQDGTRLRFVINRPANIPQFPLPAASPVGPPVEAALRLFDDRFQTSWACVAPPASDPKRRGHYVAAPKGAELFGAGTAAPDGLLGPRDPGVGVGTVAFPLLPYAGFTPQNGLQDASAEQLEQVAREIVSPTRKAAIDAAADAAPASSAHASLFADHARRVAASDALIATTTPTGFITRYAESDGTFKQLLLAQIVEGAVQQIGLHRARRATAVGLPDRRPVPRRGRQHAPRAVRRLAAGVHAPGASA